MQDVISIYKFIGETPLETIERLRVCFPEYKNVPIVYAGRLDPMADGLLLLLAGEARHELDSYLKLDKTYIVKILFGISTDTYDALGMPSFDNEIRIDEAEIENHLKAFVGKIQQPPPPFSSYKIQGKPLFAWAKEDRLDEIEIPVMSREIYNIEVLKCGEISNLNLLTDLQDRIPCVQGDFRQKEISQAWEHLLSQKHTFQTATLNISASSGTYMRSIAHELGKRLGTGAIALSIRRTRIGEFELPGDNF